MMPSLKKVRILQDKTQYDLMLKTGIHQTVISHFENGYMKPTEKQKKLLARALRVKIEEIFPEG